MAQFEFGWDGLLLVMISGGLGAVGILPLIGIGSGGVASFVLFTIILASIAAIAAAWVAEKPA